MTRLAITLDKDLATRTRKAAGRNVSRYVSDAIAMRLEEERRAALRRELAEGCIANAEEDLAICADWDRISDNTLALEGDE